MPKAARATLCVTHKPWLDARQLCLQFVPHLLPVPLSCLMHCAALVLRDSSMVRTARSLLQEHAARGGRDTTRLAHGVGRCVCAGVQQCWQHQQLLLLWMQIAVVQHCSTQGCRRSGHPRHRRCCCVSPFTSCTHTRTSASSACRLALRAASARSFASMAACWAAVISACFLSCRGEIRRHHPTRLKHQVSSHCCTTVTQSRGFGALEPAC